MRHARPETSADTGVRRPRASSSAGWEAQSVLPRPGVLSSIGACGSRGLVESCGLPVDAPPATRYSPGMRGRRAGVALLVAVALLAAPAAGMEIEQPPPADFERSQPEVDDAPPARFESSRPSVDDAPPARIESSQPAVDDAPPARWEPSRPSIDDAPPADAEASELDDVD